MMRPVAFPSGYRIEVLKKGHRKAAFRCGEAAVEEWLATKALQHQSKHLSVTKVLLHDLKTPNKTGTGTGRTEAPVPVLSGPLSDIAGYYTLATAQIDFSDLPQETAKKLPRRALPVAILAWMGVSTRHQGQGLGRCLLAQALRDCYDAGRTLPFVAVLLDCLNDAAKAFYQKWDFRELPGQPYRLYLSMKQLEAMMGDIAS